MAPRERAAGSRGRPADSDGSAPYVDLGAFQAEDADRSAHIRWESADHLAGLTGVTASQLHQALNADVRALHRAVCRR